MIKEHKQFSLPDQANQKAQDATLARQDHQQFNMPEPVVKDFDSSPNVLHTAKSIIVGDSNRFTDINPNYGVGINTKAETNSLMTAKGQYYSMRYANGTAASTATIDWAKANVQSVAITQTTTLTFASIKDGGRYIFEVQQDEVGSRAITWPATVVWPAGSAPTASGAFKVDLYAFYNNGSSTFGSSSLNY